MLPTGRYWELDGDGIDSTAFFRALPEAFPEATAFFAEGTVIDAEVEACLASHAQPGDFLPGANTIRPVSRKFRCSFSPQLCEALAALSLRHAEPEMMDHVFLYRHSEALVYWHDAFSHAMWLSGLLPEERIGFLAGRLGRRYRLVTEPQ